MKLKNLHEDGKPLPFPDPKLSSLGLPLHALGEWLADRGWDVKARREGQPLSRGVKYLRVFVGHDPNPIIITYSKAKMTLMVHKPMPSVIPFARHPREFKVADPDCFSEIEKFLET